MPVKSDDCSVILWGGHVVSTRVKNGRRRVYCTSLDSPGEGAKAKTLWKARAHAAHLDTEPRITSVLPLELGHIVIGYSKPSPLLPIALTGSLIVLLFR